MKKIHTLIIYIMKAMRYQFSLCLLFIISGISAFGQDNLIQNGDFETHGTIAPCIFQDDRMVAAFSNQCVSNWQASHGTPDLSNDALNTVAHIWATNCTAGYEFGEGFFYKFTKSEIVPGKTYTISFDYKNAGSTQTQIANGFDVRLANLELQPLTGQFQSENGCETWRQEPIGMGGTQLLAAIRHIDPVGWQSYSTTFTTDYCPKALWFLSKVEGADTFDDPWIFIDNVKIVESCELVKYYQNTQNIPPFTKVSDQIFVGSNVTSSLPIGPVVIQAGQTVELQAGNSITLQPGVLIEGSLITRIASCDEPGTTQNNSISSFTVENYGTCSSKITPTGCVLLNTLLSFTYKWTYNGNILGTGSNLIVTPVQPTYYSVEITDQYGNKNTGSVLVNPQLPGIVASNTNCGTNLSVCSSTDLQYRWYHTVGGSQSDFGTLDNVTVYPVVPTQYFVEVKEAGTGKTTILSYTVNPDPLYIRMGQQCAPPFILTVNKCNISDLTFSWAGFSDTDNDISVTPVSTYVQNVTVTDNLTGNTASTSITVANLEYSGAITYDVISNLVTPNGDGHNDIWNVKDGNKITNAYNASYFELIVTNIWGAVIWQMNKTAPRVNGGFNDTDIYWDPSSVSDGVYYYYVYMENCNTNSNANGWIQVIRALRNGLDNSTSGNVISSENELEVVPNPTTGEAIIPTLNTMISDIQLLSPIGNIIDFNYTKEIEYIKFDLSYLPDGLYLIRMNTDKGLIIRKLIIKK